MKIKKNQNTKLSPIKFNFKKQKKEEAFKNQRENKIEEPKIRYSEKIRKGNQNEIIKRKSEKRKIHKKGNALSKEAFRKALIEEDFLSEKKNILPFMKFLEQKELFGVFVEEERHDSNDFFHFLLMTNKFVEKELIP